MTEKVRIADREKTPREIMLQIALGKTGSEVAVFDIESLRKRAHSDIDKLFELKPENARVNSHSYLTYFANLPRGKDLTVEQKKELMYDSALMAELAPEIFKSGASIGRQTIKDRVDEFLDSKIKSQDLNSDDKVVGTEIKMPTPVTGELLKIAIDKISEELRRDKTIKDDDPKKMITKEERSQLVKDIERKADANNEYSLGDIKAALSDFRQKHGLKEPENGR